MTTLQSSSSSSAESTMDDNPNGQHLQTKTKTKKRSHDGLLCTDRIVDEGDAVVWGNFTDSFRQVQSVLDRNRLLIQQVNDNHHSKIAANMVKNVSLIQQINHNISEVVSLYSELSSNFSTVFHQRNGSNDARNNSTGENQNTSD